MAQTEMNKQKTTNADESQRKTADLQKQFDIQLAAASKYAKQKDLKLPTGYTDETAANAAIKAPLVATLRQINDSFRSYNNGKDYIEVPAGSSYLSRASLDRIKVQATDAFTSPANKEFADQLSTMLTTAPPESTTTVITQRETIKTVPKIVEPTQKLKEEKKAPPEEPVQVTKVQTGTQLPAGEAELLGHITYELDTIATTNAKSVPKSTKSAAAKLRDRIGHDLGVLDGKPSAVNATVAIKALERMKSEYQANSLFSKALTAARNSQLQESAVQAGITIEAASKSPIMKELLDLNARLDGIVANASKMTDKAKAADIIDGVEKIREATRSIWLLSEEEPQPQTTGNRKLSPRWDAYLQGLQPAAMALQSGDVELAKAGLNYAATIFRRDQDLNAQRLAFTKSIIDTTVSEIRNTGLPTASDLQAQEKADGIKTASNGTGKAEKEEIERNRYYHSFGNGRDNSREGLLAIMINRQQQINALLADKTKWSSSQISDLQQTVEAERHAITSLISMWQYAIENGVNKADKNARQRAWKSYSTASAIIAYPDQTTAINPYKYYPQEIRDFIIAQYKNASGNSGMSEQKVMEALIRNPQWRYEDALFGVYKTVYKLAPANAAAEPVVNQLSGLNTARVLWEYDYAQYRTMGPEATEARVEDAQDYAKTAIKLLKTAGAQDSDQLISLANAWLAQPVPTDNAGKIAYADALWSMSMDMVSIRAAEVWVQNSGVIGRTGLTSFELGNAGNTVAAARKRFEHLYNIPGFMPTSYYSYPDLPRNIANDAIRLVAPLAFKSTEIHAAYEALVQNENAKPDVDDLTTGGKEPAFADMRAAQLKDRANASEAAEKAERGHLMMLANLRNRDFWRPDILSADQALAANYGQLSPDVGRRLFNLVEVTRPIPTRIKADVHRDNMFRLHEEMAVPPQGFLYGEAVRQKRLMSDENVPLLLRTHTSLGDTFETVERAVALNYGMKDATIEAQRTGINKAYMSILDVKIKDLEDRLNGSVEVTVDGKKQTVPISRLANSEDPKGGIVLNAQADLAELKALRQQYRDKLNLDLFDGSMAMTPKQSILTAEQALASLVDENLQIRPGMEAKATFAVAKDAITYNSVGGNPERYFARVNDVVVNRDGKEYTLKDYESTYGPQNLTYRFFWYRNISEDQLLMSPAYDANVADAAHQRYVGMVVRDATLSDGTKAGDIVVRVRKSSESTSEDGIRWRAVKDRDGKIAPTEVLYHLQPGTLNPKPDELLDANRDVVSVIRSIPRDRVLGVESAIAVVSVESATGGVTTSVRK